ncbi:MAG: OadG family protein [Fusobacteriaceae bacterium]|jgi:Na+-transporting methylmalonyl-CoA/oxaloacetate decarboxylase gamma subunit|nr:OadG family protein [Fusobacteriaceae bacterium]
MGSLIKISPWEALLISGLGLSVVFLALAMLALVIIIFSIFAKKTGLDETAAPAGATTGASAGGEEDLGVVAAIIAAVTEDGYRRKENLVVTSIREIR